MPFHARSVWLMICIGLGLLCVVSAAGQEIVSHPPTRPLPSPSNRPLASDNARFVSTDGSDQADGSRQRPWKTINHALGQIEPGQTLHLRGGVYHENVYCAVAGRQDAPITIRSFPGELAVIDGGLPEFLLDPAQAWVPAEGGAPGEFRSARRHRNIRDVVGRFGDSLVGLQTYWHAMDLRSQNEFWTRDPQEKLMVLPVYCGPGLWYDKQTGYIHVRLAHTHMKHPDVANYEGETDPRKLPLVIAPFASVPLFVDQAKHVRFQDLVVRGGGQNAVVLQFGIDLEFDNVTVYCGSYGIRARGTGPLRMTNCGVYGMIPPWAWRSENSLFTYSADYYDPFVPPAEPTNQRNIARLPTHAVLVTEGSFEFEVFYYPHNHDWDISNSEFTDGHDGVYLSGNNIRFHHNWVDKIQDDAIYLSSPTPYYTGTIRIYQNLVTRALMAFGCHSRGGPTGDVYVYRNIADLRQGVNAGRPSAENPEGNVTSYHIFLVHGRSLLGIESMYFYQNTFISPTSTAGFAHRTWVNTTAETKRRIFNNIFVYLTRYPDLQIAGAPPNDIQLDGNLHWSPADAAKLPEGFLEKVRACAAAEKNKEHYAPGWAAHSQVADPGFTVFGAGPAAKNDYRLGEKSPARGAGVALPAEWEDPLRTSADQQPDVGAIPSGAKPPQFGRQGRITFPLAGKPADP